MGDQHDHHGHAHGGHNHGGDATERALRLALVFNFAFLLLEAGVGLWTNSLALLSDAGHMVSDVAALAVALFAQRLARVSPSGSFTYGFKRAPVLGAFGNALTLLAIVALIFWEAAHRLADPPPIPGLPVLWIGIAGLAVNGFSAWWLHRSADQSLNIRGAMLHLLADALGSIGAIVAAVVLLTTGWGPIDPLISFGIGGLILWSTWPLLRDSAKVLLEAAPEHLDVEEIRQVFQRHEKVRRVLDLHVWELDSGRVVLTAMLEAAECDLAVIEHDSDTLRAELAERFAVDHSTIEWRAAPGAPAGCNPDEPTA
jgi:cobalt-zinc-cadmium efflux system protein